MSNVVQKHKTKSVQFHYLLVPLSNPHLRHVFGIDGRQCSVQCHLVEISIYRGGEKDQRRAFARCHLQVHGWEFCLSPLRAIVEIDQNGHYPLSSICSKPPAVFVGYIKGIKVLQQQ